MIHECHIDTLTLPDVPGPFEFTPEIDVRLIAFWATNSKGDYLEIGCNTGRTLKQIASLCPDKICRGVDWSKNEILWDTQQTEIPLKVGSNIEKKSENIRVFDCDALTLEMHDFNFGCVFLDAEHSLEFQKEMFKKLWNSNNYRDWILIVHDCPNVGSSYSFSHLETLAFLRYVGSMFPVTHWIGSNCATAFITRRGSESTPRADPGS